MVKVIREYWVKGVLDLHCAECNSTCIVLSVTLTRFETFKLLKADVECDGDDRADGDIVDGVVHYRLPICFLLAPQLFLRRQKKDRPIHPLLLQPFLTALCL